MAELTANSYCVACAARIPIDELMCSSCKKKRPTQASRIRKCGECGRPYMAKPTAEQTAQEFLEAGRK